MLLIKSKKNNKPPYRLSEHKIGKEMHDLIKSCWSENPDQRPSFNNIKSSLKQQAKGELDHLLF